MAAIDKKRARAEDKRRGRGARHRVEYFHQVDDGYSHLAAQLLRPLLDQYEIDLVCHLVTVKNDDNLPEPELLLPLSRYESGKVASHYGLRFPADVESPDPARVALAEQILSAVDSADFPEAAVAVGDALWSGDDEGLKDLEAKWGRVESALALARVEAGTARRGKLGHYSGAMFHYGAEWYWGADRIYHLEKRLCRYGARRDGGTEWICPRPEIERGPCKDDGSISLEFYPSMRSPYTSIIYDKVIDLVDATGVELILRPVLPMVMRGVSATRQKGLYIMRDTAREADELGLQWGAFYDPIGEPVRNCYSLYPWACKQGKGRELLSRFLNAAFFEGINTNNDRGMCKVVEDAGLSWAEAKAIMGNRDWEAELEDNRITMYDFGSWGVPSFRLFDAVGHEVLAVWGQDRLWLVSREIQRLLREAQA